MSIPLGADLSDTQDVQISESKPRDSDVDDLNHNNCPEKKCPHHDEYTALLKKQVSALESELKWLKGIQTTESNVADENDSAGKSKVDKKDMQQQEARIHRVSPWEWRKFKNECAINPELPALIAYSKSIGRVGRRSTGRRSMRENGAPESGKPNKGEDSSPEIAYRLAINSKILLKILGDCTDMEFPEDRNVWLRPFKYLVAYETELRQALQNAEVSLQQVEAGTGPSGQADPIPTHNGLGISDTIPVQERIEVSADAVKLAPHTGAMGLTHARAARDQLSCLINFMDTDMQDIFDVKRQVADQTLKEVALEHLWLVFEPGDLVYSTNSPDESSMYQAYRVLHVTGGRPVLGISSNSRASETIDWDSESETEEKARDNMRVTAGVTPFIIDCFFIDFDGNRLGPKSRRFAIPAYSGKRKLDALEVFPCFVPPQHSDVYRALIERGRRFTRLANGTHKRYSGATLTESRELWGKYNSIYNYFIHADEIHGEVMLDQAAAVTYYRKNYTKWRLKLGGSVIGVPTGADRREVFDPLPVQVYEEERTDVFDDSIIDLYRRKEFVDFTKLIRYLNILEPSLSDDYVMLLPFRIYGYALLNRKWFPLNINLVDDITPNQLRTTAAGYEDLVLPDGHKKLLQAIVKHQVTDSEQISGKQEEGPDDFQMDLVKGKGTGLIILLHGAPGVGKTSTAECVAAQLKRPLLPITCGDIGTYVSEAEETLQDYCRLAHRWKCVLLLDEADFFLAKRENGDIKRNGLVSVFLRVLEYFSGVIILTTNRVGGFDEAFRSRIHVSLYYPKLDKAATLRIWDRSLQRLQDSGLRLDLVEDEIRQFASNHWLENEGNSSRHWNGRQIKNAFQTALALAYWEFHNTKQVQSLERPLLKAKHFDRVAKTSAQFDDYISEIYGIGEDAYSLLAKRDNLRNDTHPAISLGRSSQTQEFVPHSKRTTPARRGVGTRDARVGEGRMSEGDSDRMRRLEIELELMRMKQTNSKEEVQAQVGGDEDDELW